MQLPHIILHILSAVCIQPDNAEQFVKATRDERRTIGSGKGHNEALIFQIKTVLAIGEDIVYQCSVLWRLAFHEKQTRLVKVNDRLLQVWSDCLLLVLVKNAT